MIVRSISLRAYRMMEAPFRSLNHTSTPVLKRERVNRVRYRTREAARADLFEYIEVFYNRKRRHGYLGNISPADFERQSAGSF